MSEPEHRREHIVLETTRHRIFGVVTLPREGYRSRVSDFLNASERDFISLIDATITPHDGGPPEGVPFLAVSRRHIVFMILDEDAK